MKAVLQEEDIALHAYGCPGILKIPCVLSATRINCSFSGPGTVQDKRGQKQDGEAEA